MPREAIIAEGLGKRYRLGERIGGYDTLRERLASSLRGLPHAEHDEIWALQGVDFSIDEGEVVGIVGRNGAGKTTLLKTVAAITRPTRGLVRVRGRVGALLEVGTGFHPELTGRENVFLNGVILGMSRRDVRRRFDEIVEFAGVQRFLDTPLKRYSSGMYLRLAFSVAAHVEPDVVIVDEVLAVGDVEFQRRCLGRMSELGTEGRTVLFVSHDLGAVGQLCSRALWLEQGRIVDDGDSRDVLDRYFRASVDEAPEADLPVRPGSPIAAAALSVLDEKGNVRTAIRRDEVVRLRLRLDLRTPVHGLDASVYVLDARGGRVVNENASDSGARIEARTGTLELQVTVPPVLGAGTYVVGAWAGTTNDVFVHRELIRLTILPLPTDREDATHGVVRSAVTWRGDSDA